jgi:hypothetical protein
MREQHAGADVQYERRVGYAERLHVRLRRKRVRRLVRAWLEAMRDHDVDADVLYGGGMGSGFELPARFAA